MALLCSALLFATNAACKIKQIFTPQLIRSIAINSNGKVVRNLLRKLTLLKCAAKCSTHIIIMMLPSCENGRKMVVGTENQTTPPKKQKKNWFSTFPCFSVSVLLHHHTHTKRTTAIDLDGSVWGCDCGVCVGGVIFDWFEKPAFDCL
jgi:hypothetical protein